MHSCVFAPATPAAILKAAVARSNVTVYAVVEARVSYNNNGNPTDKSWGAGCGQPSTSRIGFKAPAELGTGMFVSDGLKKGTDADAGAFTQSHSTASRLYGRPTFAGSGACYLYRPMKVQFSYHNANTVTMPTASDGITSEERAAFFGAIYDVGAGYAHVVYADKKPTTIKGDGTDRNDSVSVPASAGAAGKVMAPETRNQVRDMSSGYFDRYAIGYTYLLPVCTNLYTSYSYLKNDVALATYNDSVYGTNVKRFNVGMRQIF